MHYFPGLDQEKIMWEVSYVNLSMYLATVPSYESDEATGTSPDSKNEKPVEQKKRDEIKNFFKNT